ncbi:Hypothetical predicted protein [Olea europaea subsp. europaea]|uniref:Uncharacterized protein n=1 Tax=Olea europaea subsp. europaea TaxID=158383 RepID=A0A8S0TQQ4_OLEEU|nr:Hypothetical predicted protein [Olea europaea subsp. europaea]
MLNHGENRKGLKHIIMGMSKKTLNLFYFLGIFLCLTMKCDFCTISVYGLVEMTRSRIRCRMKNCLAGLEREAGGTNLIAAIFYAHYSVYQPVDPSTSLN